MSAKDTVCSCSSLAATIASRSISDTWLMIQFEIKLNTLTTKETTGYTVLCGTTLTITIQITTPWVGLFLAPFKSPLIIIIEKGCHMKGQKRAGETMPQPQTRCGVPYPLSPIPLFFPLPPYPIPLSTPTRVCPVVIRRTKRKYPGKNLKQASVHLSR